MLTTLMTMSSNNPNPYRARASLYLIDNDAYVIQRNITPLNLFVRPSITSILLHALLSVNELQFSLEN
jgi:hypothetical protein